MHGIAASSHVQRLSDRGADPMARWLCLGGAGFIGSTFSLHAARAGDLVHIYDDRRSRGTDMDQLLTRSRNLQFTCGAIEDRDLLTQTLNTFKPDGVVHFAAEIDVARSVREPKFFRHANVDCSVSMLESVKTWRMRSSADPVFVFSSSAAVYGQSVANSKIAETVPPQPINPYGETKLEVERELLRLAEQDAWRVVSLRYFNAAGAWPDEGLGECHDPETHLIPLALEKALGVRPNIQIFGDDYGTPDGTAIRDYIHIRDLAEAHLRALRKLQTGKPPIPAMNLGTGSGVSVREVLQEVERITGVDLGAQIAPRRAGDPAFLVADPSVFEAWGEWKAQSSLSEMIIDAWRFRRETKS